MLKKIETLDNVGNIVIVDNGSTYPPLLDWYSTKPCEIIYQSNIGHLAPWNIGLVNKLSSKHYVVTDPDLNLDHLPDDTLDFLDDILKQLKLAKLSLGLVHNDIPKDSPYYAMLRTKYKTLYDTSKTTNGVYLDVPGDTTFAMYSSNIPFVGGSSTMTPYMAKHLPWYMTDISRKNDEEFSFYLAHANKSCSYKEFLKL